MKDFQKRGRSRKIMHTKPMLFIFGIVILFFIFNITGFLRKMNETMKNRSIVEEKISELENTKEKLNTDIQKLNTEEGIEESIREKFGLASEGEQLIVIVDEEVDSATKEEEKEGFWANFKTWFK